MVASLTLFSCASKQEDPTPVPPSGPPTEFVWDVQKQGEYTPNHAEKSGMCIGTDGRMYTIQDSDNPPQVVVTDLTGKLLGKITMVVDGKEVQNQDFEAVACDHDKVYVGDIGDGASPQYVYSFAYPKEATAKVFPHWQRFKSDLNFEGLAVFGGHVLLASKDWDGADQSVYELVDGVLKKQFRLKIPNAIGDMSVSPDGKTILFAQDESNLFWECNWDGDCEAIELKVEGDHEAVTYLDDNSFLFTSEDGKEIYKAEYKPTPDVEPTPTIPPVQTGDWWRPGPVKSFQIFHFDSMADLKSKYNGAEIVNLELDQIERAGGKAVSDYIHSKGGKLVCYFSLGFEDWRSDAKEYPKDAMGNKMADWAGEAWGNVSKPSLHEFLKKRMQRCLTVGGDGIEIDNLDAYGNRDESGINITLQQNIDGVKRLAEIAHGLGLAHFQKNSTEMVGALNNFMDGIFVESCADYDECEKYAPYRGRPVMMVQYKKKCPNYDWAVCLKKSDYFK